MKKIILFFLALFFVVGANAQLRLGVKAGGNLSKFNAYKHNNYIVGDLGMKFGFHVGAVAEYSFGKLFAVQPELQFMMYGGKIEERAVGSTTGMLKSDVNMSQLQLPVNLKFKINIDSLQIFVMAGPYLGWGISAKRKSEAAGIADIDPYKKKELKRFDYGLNAMVGVEVRKFTLGVGYQFSLMNIDDRNSKNNVKMGTALLSLGYFIR